MANADNGVSAVEVEVFIALGVPYATAFAVVDGYIK